LRKLQFPCQTLQAKRMARVWDSLRSEYQHRDPGDEGSLTRQVWVRRGGESSPILKEGSLISKEGSLTSTLLREFEQRLAGLEQVEDIRLEVERMDRSYGDLVERMDKVDEYMSVQLAQNTRVDEFVEQLKSKQSNLDNLLKGIKNELSTEFKSLRIRVENFEDRSGHAATFEQRLLALEENSSLEVVVKGDQNESTHESLVNLEKHVQNWVGEHANFKGTLESMKNTLESLQKERDDRRLRDFTVDQHLLNLKSQLKDRGVSAKERAVWSIELKPGQEPGREQVSKVTSRGLEEYVLRDAMKRLFELEREHDRSPFVETLGSR